MILRFSVFCWVGWLAACAATQAHGAGDAGPDAGEDSHEAALDAATTALPDADAGRADAAPPLAPRLCDGSKDMRLIWQIDDQITAFSYSFIVPYGSAIFALDGECRFHALRDYREGYATGTLSAEQEVELSRELAFAELLRVGSQIYRPLGACADVPARIATTSEGTVRCACGCPAETPEAISSALHAHAEGWLARMLQQAEPPTTALSALAIPRGAGYLPAAGEPKPWPLAQSLEAVPNLKLSGMMDPRWSKGPYARIDDAQEVAALRALREANLSEKIDSLVGTLVEAGAEVYRLFVRDELPENVAQALKELQAKSKRQ